MEKDIKEEVENLLTDKTDAEISEEFIAEYRKLCRKYGRDFVQGEIHVVKLEFSNKPI